VLLEVVTLRKSIFPLPYYLEFCLFFENMRWEYETATFDYEQIANPLGYSLYIQN
jgi:hypothetical protein